MIRTDQHDLGHWGSDGSYREDQWDRVALERSTDRYHFGIWRCIVKVYGARKGMAREAGPEGQSCKRAEKDRVQTLVLI